jgi:hypothetical protein
MKETSADPIEIQDKTIFRNVKKYPMMLIQVRVVCLERVSC